MYEINFEMILGKEIMIYHIISNILFMNNAQRQKTMRLNNEDASRWESQYEKL